MAYQPKTRNCNSNLYVVGYNHRGQLGLNHTNNIKQLTQYNNDSIDIARVHVGGGYCIFESSQHKYYSAGHNEYGQCAVDNFDDAIPKCRHIEYFNKINKNVKKIFVSPNSHSVFWSTTNNEIYANGKNGNYQLGINKNNISTDDAVSTSVLDISSGIVCALSFGTLSIVGGQNQSKPSIIVALKDIKDIQSGHEHSVAMDNNGNVYGAGNSKLHKLYSDVAMTITHSSYHENIHKRGWSKIMFFENKQIKQIKCGKFHTLFLSAGNSLYAAGTNTNHYGQLGQGNYGDSTKPLLIKYFTRNYISVKDICCGYAHNLAIDYKGRLYAWGCNESGQCGIDKSANMSLPQLVESLKTENITKIQCGSYHSCVGSVKGKYFTFGWNKYNEVSLVQQKEDEIFIPKYINDIVSKITNGKRIKNVCLGYGCTFIFVSDSIQSDYYEEEKSDDCTPETATDANTKMQRGLRCMEVQEKCNDGDERKEEKPQWITVRKAKRHYDEKTEDGEIKVAVDKIVDFIISGVGAYATGGALLPVLAKQLKDAVVHVSWSKSQKNEDIVEHFYHNNTYFFIEIKRKVEKYGFNWFVKIQEFKIEVKVKWFYFEAENVSAKKVLAKLASDQVAEASEYVSKCADKWS